MQVELTDNPSILFEPTMQPELLTVFGYALNQDAHEIDRSLINDTSLAIAPTDAEYISIRVGVHYYTRAGQLIEWPLSERVHSVVEHGGWLHMTYPVRYRIEEGRIVQIRLTGDLLEYYQVSDKSDIMRKFGASDSIDEYFEEIDGALFHTTFEYRNRKLRIMFSDWDHKIIILNIGQPIIVIKTDRTSG